MHSILGVGSYLCRSTQKPGRSMQKRARLERALLKCRVSGQSRALVGDTGGREFTEAIRGVPSPPWSWGSGRALGYDPSLGSFWDWMGTEPDPQSAGAQVGAAGCRGEGGEPLAGPNVGAHHGAWRGLLWLGPRRRSPCLRSANIRLEAPRPRKIVNRALRLRRSRCQQIKQSSLIEHRHVELASLVELGPCLFSGNHVTCFFAD
jgi:hypothetical protein